VAAFGVIGAADEGAEAAEFEGEASGAAAWAEARVAPGSVVWAILGKEMAAELGVERFEHRLDRQVLGAGDGGREIAPEIAEQLFPVDAPAGNLVELVLQVGGKIVFDVALEKAGQERGDQTTAVLGHEAALVELHILAVL